MEHIRWTTDRPEIESPALILAFEGWNDAGEAATTAAQHIVDRLVGNEFATIDPEPFYDFTAARPDIVLADGDREIQWPSNTFSWIPGTSTRTDLIIMSGVEPQLRWRTYTEQILAIVEEFDVDLVVTLGALIADVVHSRPTAVYASSYDPKLIAELDLEPSSYEGPTGIVGVVNEGLRAQGYGAISLWGTVPSYVPHAASPKATLALITRISTLLGITVPTTALEIAASAYERQITDLVDDDEDTKAYIARLEEEYDSSMTPESGQELIAELEQFLRDRE